MGKRACIHLLGHALAALLICTDCSTGSRLGSFCLVYTELLDKTYYLNHYYFATIWLLPADPGTQTVFSWIYWRSLRPAHRAVDILLFKYQLCMFIAAGVVQTTGTG